mmetsp:Transcript_13764/g.28139  ORF Transcript_13764/g.28139 Transcript_13764/m.28139 type:complete len:259 (-) Transcript_13764:194-970(-)
MPESTSGRRTPLPPKFKLTPSTKSLISAVTVSSPSMAPPTPLVMPIHAQTCLGVRGLLNFSLHLLTVIYFMSSKWTLPPPSPPLLAVFCILDARCSKPTGIFELNLSSAFWLSAGAVTLTPRVMLSSEGTYLRSTPTATFVPSIIIHSVALPPPRTIELISMVALRGASSSSSGVISKVTYGTFVSFALQSILKLAPSPTLVYPSNAVVVAFVLFFPMKPVSAFHPPGSSLVLILILPLIKEFLTYATPTTFTEIAPV